MNFHFLQMKAHVWYGHSGCEVKIKVRFTTVASCGVCVTKQHTAKYHFKCSFQMCFGGVWGHRSAKLWRAASSHIKVEFPTHRLNLCLFGPQLAPRLSTRRPPAPAGTGVLSWLSWSHRTVAVTTCVRPTTAAARTSISSASGQVLSQPPCCWSSDLFFPFFVAFLWPQSF